MVRHDVVVVGRLAADVGMLAGREVEAFDGADLLEELERAEDGGAPDGGTALLGRGDQLGGGEVAVLLGDQRGQRPAGLRHAVAGAVEGGDDRGWVGHLRRLAQLRHSLNTVREVSMWDGPPGPPMS